MTGGQKISKESFRRLLEMAEIHKFHPFETIINQDTNLKLLLMPTSRFNYLPPNRAEPTNMANLRRNS
jgi:hypothetical protein